MTNRVAQAFQKGNVIFRLAWHHARRRRLQSAFLVIGIAIGVAMMVAVDLANGSAERAFELGTEAVTGRATHQIAGGPNGINEATYASIRREAGYRLSAPVVEEYISVSELDGQPIRLLGIDPLAEAPFRSYLGTQGAADTSPDVLTNLMARPNTVLISQDVANAYGLQPGDNLTAQHGGNRFSLEIVGMLAPYDDLSRRALETLVIADISTAQEVLSRVGRLNRIDLLIDEGPAGQATIERLASYLGDDEYIAASAARNGAVGEMTRAFRLNLTALSLLALVVGMFLIYNTVTFSVIQRRPVLGSLRALGMTRKEVFGLILVEALTLGIVGTILGLGLGILLGRSAVQLVSQTINDLFFVVSVREIAIPAITLIKGAITGLLVSLFAAAIPAWEATSIPPAGALQRSNIEERSRTLLPWISIGAVVLLAVGALLLMPDWGIVVSFAGLFAVILGSALLTPLLTHLLMSAAQRVASSFSGIIGRMAPRYVTRSLSRTSVAVAALMVSVSVIIGVGIMIESFRGTVEVWLNDVLQADIYVSPPSLNANQVSTSLDPDTLLQLEGFPGIARTATQRGVDVPVLWDESSASSATLSSPSSSSASSTENLTVVRLNALSEDLAGSDRRYRASVGDWRETWQSMENGSVIINEPMANRFDLEVGDTLPLLTDRGREPFEIAGVAVGFDVSATAYMHDPVFRAYWDDEGISAVALFVEPGVDVDEKVSELRRALSTDGEVVVRSNLGTREEALAVFDRTFAITIALQILAIIVAFIGILSTLMSLQLERTREIGILRSNGMTRRQLWRLSLYETGLIGSSAGLIALPTGLALAAILIYIINLRSFGWSMEMQLAGSEFVQAFLVALTAALVAGIYPAWRMSRIAPATAIRNE
jgi:putative ABC transport system permease protein